MAEVFKASPSGAPGTFLAIKRILPQFSRHRELIAMLIREASLTAGLSHPNLVPILDFGAVDDTYFIAMEFIHGKDLKSIMLRLNARKGEFPIPLAVHITVSILRGLDYAHHKCDKYGRPLALVHRDISPQNVMISFEGRIQVLDFGIAKASARSAETESGVLKGKFSYMSPEQARGEDVDPRSDLFAAGIVLWEMLTLRPCFDGETDLALLENVRDGTVRNPSDVNARIPRELSDIVLKALEKKPRRRYESAGDFADALERYQKERFGTLTDADTAAFMRGLYPLPASEHRGTPRRALAKTPSGPRPPSGIHRAPWARKSRPYLKRIPLASVFLIGAAMLAGKFSPVDLFLRFDRLAVAWGAKIHALRQERRPVLPTGGSVLSPTPRPLYSVSLSPPARLELNGLPFETFESLRDFIGDLGGKGTPREAAPVASRPGTWTSTIEGIRVTYQIDDLSRTIRIERIEKGGK
jgi:serine/threonine protein kinase